jgi:SPP1 family predicted phage head-tail adaptor
MKAACRPRPDKKITVQRLTGTADAAGHVDGNTDANWTVYAIAWATAQTRGGREFWKVQQVESTVDTVFRCPWTRALEQSTPAMRINYDGTIYEILSVVNVDLADDIVEFQCRRRTT